MMKRHDRPERRSTRSLSTFALAAVVAILCGHPARAGESLRLDSSPTLAARLREQAEARKVKLTVKRCGRAPSVDGSLDDTAWKDAAKARLPGEPLTILQACFDETALYLGVVCREAAGYQAAAEARARDGAVWKDDCLEMFFLPPGAGFTYYQFVVNAAGSVYDGRGRTGAYDPEWSHAVSRDDQGWTAEVAFPYRALELDGPVSRVGFNMHRVGPNLQMRTWARPGRDPAAGALLLEGVTARGPLAVEGPAEDSRQLAVSGSSLSVRLDRFEAEPGERWLPVELSLRPRVPLAQARVEAEVFAIGRNEPAEAVSATPERSEAVLKVNLRPKGFEQGRIEIALLEDGDQTGAATILVSHKPCARPLKTGERIPVRLDVPRGMGPVRTWPVTFGLPFPAGALWEPTEGPLPIRLVDENGAEIPSQFEVAARWAPEGSVKWVRADALVSPRHGCFMEASPPGKPAAALRLIEEGDRVTVETGPGRFILGKGPSPIREIWRDGRRVATTEATRGLYLVDQTGRLAKASAEEERMDVEARGPVAACVRFEGWYQADDGQRLARHITRIEAFAGQAFLRVTHTLVLTEDTNQVWFKDLGWELAIEPGASPEAVFGLAPPATDFRKTATVALEGRTRSAYMLQDSHYRFTLGTNHFSVAAAGADGEETKQHEGEECGDWAALRTKASGLLVGCRDAARQHPKEFEVFPDRMVLHLFSNRAGEELDYRTKMLMKRWNLPEWIRLHNRKGRANGTRDEKEMIAKLEAYVNDASGGARTHDLFFAAVAPGAAAEDLARLGGLHGEPIYALADPQWSYETRVMGPNHPVDRERFPEAEKAVRETFQFYLDRDAAWGEHGFVDYFAGPHCVGHMDDRVPVLFRYNEFTYFFRAQIWLLYARSGDRAIRRFAEGTNRAYLDNRFVHWGDRTGHWRMQHSVINLVPIYWHKGYRLLSLGEMVSNFTTYYYLTGDRRIADGLLQAARLYKSNWSESMVLRDWTKNSILQHCAQLHELTGDEDLAAMADRTLDLITDPENGILLTKRAYNSSTYKTSQGIRHLFEAYRLRPRPKLRQLCQRVAEWLQEFPYGPFGYTRSGSIVGPLLYDLTQDPAQAQSLAVALRNIGGLIDPKTGKLDYGAMRKKVGIAPYTTFLFDIGYAIDAVVRAGLDKKPNAASWVCYTDDTGRARPILRKGKDEVVRIHYQTPVKPNVTMLDTDVNQVTRRDFGVMSMRQDSASHDGLSVKGEIRMPKDLPAGDYLIKFDRGGSPGLFASSRTKLILYAPDYWMPMPRTGGPGAGPPDRQRPAFRYYFQVPKGAAQAQIFFAAEAQLYDPSGRLWGEAGEVRGWVDLPANNPGLWSFAPVRQGMVRTRNIPPFFAFNDPDAYFLPPALDWQSDAPQDEPPLPADSLYVPGPSGRANDQAVYLSDRKYFLISPPEGAAPDFIPHDEGTLEFHIRPNWSFFDLEAGERRGLVAPGFFVDQWPDCIRFTWPTEGRLSKAPFGGTRTGPSMLLKDRWTHVAIVWGPSRNAVVISGRYGPKDITRQKRQKKLDLTIYVNGRRSRQSYINHPIPADGQHFQPRRYLVIGGLGEHNRIDAAIDNLRLSDAQRYWEDFSPPPRECQFTVDRHTRALYLFNGDLQGQSWGLGEPLTGRVRE